MDRKEIDTIYMIQDNWKDFLVQRIEKEIAKAKLEVAEDYFKHEASGGYDPADYLREIIKENTEG